MARKLDTSNAGLFKRAVGRSGAGAGANAALFGLSASMRYREIPLDRIEPDPDQPRRNARDADIATLAASIDQKGLLQPINVREVAADQFRIIAGERRYWAFRQLGRETIPALVLDTVDTQALALIENVQRVDLHPVDVARSLDGLIGEKGLTQEQAAVLIGKSQEYVARLLGILRLPPAIIDEAPARPEVSVSSLMELAEIGDAAAQLALWRGEGGALTVKSLRAVKQNRPAPVPAPAATSFRPTLKTLHTGVAKLRDLSGQGARLTDEDRDALRTLRVAIDALIGR
ncbi:ParB/RepB/Spo0J family partition protein [Azospirillum sp. RWY-5-1]|uniref:ParB/RepB/Spo0J family partition protein n=1 Tax=Azospirillum oleiclasticum TaxID=2735135 RepID=A0ABX2TKW8_9PROT|nr:ParB/RepB/Spo0J family partition protein [Azospirillum oleiclasticum]NYZ25005.1 ParB/RepB/Spo0J family partition protein [Azospirillum oleiclasticum]